MHPGQSRKALLRALLRNGDLASGPVKEEKLPVPYTSVSLGAKHMSFAYEKETSLLWWEIHAISRKSLRCMYQVKLYFNIPNIMFLEHYPVVYR